MKDRTESTTGAGPLRPAAAHLVLESGAGERARLLIGGPARDLGDGRSAAAEDEVRAPAAVAADGRLGGVEADRCAAGRTGRGETDGHGRQALGTARVSADARAPAAERATRAVT